jgi:hypothetical protein
MKLRFLIKMAAVGFFVASVASGCSGSSASSSNGGAGSSGASSSGASSSGDAGSGSDTGTSSGPDGGQGQGTDGAAVGCPASAPMSGDACAVVADGGQCMYLGGTCNSSSSGGSTPAYFTCFCEKGSWDCGGWGC